MSPVLSGVFRLDASTKGIEMTRKLKRILPVICLVATILSITLLPTAGYCETLRFVFFADSPGSSIAQPVNTPVLGAIVTKILELSPRPWAVFVGGDLALLYDDQQFLLTMKPLTDAGIKLYTALGNHELYTSGNGQFSLAGQTAFQQTFTSNPSNGPTGYDHLVYSLESPGGDAFFAVLDPYYLTADVASPDQNGTITDAQLTWLRNQVANTNATHKFLFIHTPFSYVALNATTPNDSFNQLWTILDDSLFDIYFCGHEHLYSRNVIDSTTTIYPPRSTPTWKNRVVQLICGAAGAQIEGGVVVDPNVWHVSASADTYYFSVVDINGSNVEVSSYSGNTTPSDYTVFDSFSINKDVSLLWAGTGGSAALWTLNSSNTLTDKPMFGPYSGWTPVSYTINPDGTRTLLWAGAGGSAAIWTLDSSNTLRDKPMYGPYSGWTPMSYSVNPDGTRTLLWAGEGGYAAIWTLDSSNTLTDKPMYGPYSGWTPVSYSVNPDGTRTLLWAGEGGYAAIWTLDSSNTLTDKPMYGPYSGWTPVSYAVNPDGTRTLLWSGTGGYAAIWTFDSSNILTDKPMCGPYGGWTPMSYSANPYGTRTLLWAGEGGYATLWTLDSSNNLTASRTYGPYIGWTPIKCQ